MGSKEPVVGKHHNETGSFREGTPFFTINSTNFEIRI